MLVPSRLAAQVSFSANQLTFFSTVVGKPSAAQTILVTTTARCPSSCLGRGSMRGDFRFRNRLSFQPQSERAARWPARYLHNANTIHAICSRRAEHNAQHLCDRPGSNVVNQPGVLLSGTGSSTGQRRPAAESDRAFPIRTGGQYGDLTVGMSNWGPDANKRSALAGYTHGYTVVSCYNASTSAPCDNTALRLLLLWSRCRFHERFHDGGDQSATASQPSKERPATADADGLHGIEHFSNRRSGCRQQHRQRIKIHRAASSVALSDTSVDFGLQLDHATPLASKSRSPAWGQAARVSGISIQGIQYEFSESDDCPRKIMGCAARWQLLHHHVYVFPLDDGARTATLSIFDSAPDSPQKVSLTATVTLWTSSHRRAQSQCRSRW